MYDAGMAGFRVLIIRKLIWYISKKKLKINIIQIRLEWNSHSLDILGLCIPLCYQLWQFFLHPEYSFFCYIILIIIIIIIWKYSNYEFTLCALISNLFKNKKTFIIFFIFHLISVLSYLRFHVSHSLYPFSLFCSWLFCSVPEWTEHKILKKINKK